MRNKYLMSSVLSLAQERPDQGAGALPCPYEMLASSDRPEAVAKLEVAATTRHARTYQAAWYFLRRHPVGAFDLDMDLEVISKHRRI